MYTLYLPWCYLTSATAHLLCVGLSPLVLSCLLWPAHPATLGYFFYSLSKRDSESMLGFALLNLRILFFSIIHFCLLKYKNSQIFNIGGDFRENFQSLSSWIRRSRLRILKRFIILELEQMEKWFLNTRLLLPNPMFFQGCKSRKSCLCKVPRKRIFKSATQMRFWEWHWI